MPAVTLLFVLSIFFSLLWRSFIPHPIPPTPYNAFRFLHPPSPHAGCLQLGRYLGHILTTHSLVGACSHLRVRERSCRPSCMLMIALWPTGNRSWCSQAQVKGALAHFGRSPMRKLLPAVCKQPGDMCDRCVPASANHGASPTTILIDTCS